MSLSKCGATVNVIASLGDNPNTDDNLTASQLKAKFDQAGSEIKDYINNTLTEEVDTALAADISGSKITNNSIAVGKLVITSTFLNSIGIKVGNKDTITTSDISTGQIYLKYT